MAKYLNLLAHIYARLFRGQSFALFLVDVQNDFMLKLGRLSGGGSEGDGFRLAKLIATIGGIISHIIRTFDSHLPVHIGHIHWFIGRTPDEHPAPYSPMTWDMIELDDRKPLPTQWVKDANGNDVEIPAKWYVLGSRDEVPELTQLWDDGGIGFTLDTKLFNNLDPNNAEHNKRKTRLLAMQQELKKLEAMASQQNTAGQKRGITMGIWTVLYLIVLEAGAADGKRRIHTVWATHVVQGSNGWAMFQPVQEAIEKWLEEFPGSSWVTDFFKGLSPFSEMFSVVKAAFPLLCFPETLPNGDLLRLLKQFNWVLVAGQKISHCVMDSVDDVIDDFGSLSSHLIIILDCCSSIADLSVIGGENHPKLSDEWVIRIASQNDVKFTTSDRLEKVVANNQPIEAAFIKIDSSFRYYQDHTPALGA